MSSPKQAFQFCDFEWHQITATAKRGKGLRGKETSQRSRSFLYLTLATILLDCDDFRNLAKTTISCSQVGRLKYIKGINLKEIRHCGICFPCVIRRLSMHSGNLWNNDARYNKNILGEFPDILRRDGRSCSK